MEKKIAPSILSADFARLGEEIHAVEEAGADYIHIDVMDGHFVPNITIGPMVVKAVRQVTDLPLDVHLMIENAELFIDAFRDAGTDILTVHAEAVTHLQRTLAYIRGQGMKAGVSLNPATPLCVLDHVLEDTDMVLVMTVNPGFEGQKFIRSMIPKVRTLSEIIRSKGLEVEIEVDGGIGPDTIGEISSAGANVFVAGSAIFYSQDYKETISLMRSRM